MFSRLLLVFSLFVLCMGIAQSQSNPLTCSDAAVNPALRAEGVAEAVGDILVSCIGGSPGAAFNVNLAIFLNVGVTNRLSTTGATDVSLAVDLGAGPAPAAVPGVPQGSNGVSFNGVAVTIPASRGFSFRISNLRGNISQLGSGFQAPVVASISLTGLPLVSSLNPVSVGIPAPGLLASYASAGIRCTGSALPSTIGFSSLFTFGTRFASTRVTEGFATAFETKVRTADTGIRILARYNGFPAGARIFVPAVVAGSDALQPTAAGDLGGTPSAGAYAPGGSLLLAYVNGTDANGAGGTVAYTPGAAGSGIVAFDALSEVRLTSGSGVAVYEVVDANPNVTESAQFPTFLGLPAITDGSTPVASEQVSFAPVTSVFTSTTTDPIPRFLGNPPASDCPAVGDCNSGHFPSLSVFASQPLQFTAIAASAPQTKTVQVNNKGGGTLSWTASVLNGSSVNWLTLYPGGGVNGGTVLVTVNPQAVGPGVYNATLLIDGGPQAGSQTLPITFTVTAFPPPTTLPTPPLPPVGPSSTVVLQSVGNAARPDSTAVSPGSLAIVKGSHLKGTNVAVTFDGIPATMLTGDDSSVTVQLPATLTAGLSSQLQVTVDGNKSAPLAVPVSDLAPEIFSDGVINEDGSVNSPDNGATVGSTLQVRATGLIPAVLVPIMVKLHDRQLTPVLAGSGPGVGVDQVSVVIPSDLPAMITQVSVCGYGMMNPSQPICSQPVDVTLQQRQE
jgi:uncharacterized protein (TIGR03437 family)